MLRALFGEPRRKDEGMLRETNQTIRRYINALTLIPPDRQMVEEKRYIVYSENFLRALDELEQSKYVAERYAGRVHKRYVGEMSEDEGDDYHRHLYYYKNAIIRLFAILDKLGYFMNERFILHTEKIKERFSYFTVLRNMHKNGQHTGLEERLFELKEKYADPVGRLRTQRNMEIHTINTDLLDDLLKAAEARNGGSVRQETDELQSNLRDLEQGFEMTCHAVAIVFGYLIHQPSHPKDGIEGQG